MHRRAIMDGYVMEEYGYPPYQANFGKFEKWKNSRNNKKNSCFALPGP